MEDLVSLKNALGDIQFKVLNWEYKSINSEDALKEIKTIAKSALEGHRK